jgi:actin related protein 2/3 complex subunit 1A/1B
MAEPEVYTLAQTPITSHAFSPDRSQVAVSLNSNEVTIFGRSKNEWLPVDTLAEHDKVITCIDWAPNSNRIVTASQDRNAYVWTQAQDPQTGATIWKPTLVLLRINRAATFVRWSPFEDKFAVASGARAVAICSFDPENDWWVARQLKKPIRSTVLSVDWHPNNVLLAAGSADSKARVFSAFIKDVDKKPAPSVWGEKLPFNTVCGEFPSPNGGWVHAVGFSPSGDVLAFASHDSTVNIVYPSQGVQTIRLSSLPFVTLTWTAENALVAAGHDCLPVVISGSGPGDWGVTGALDDASGGKAGGSSGIKNSPVGRLNSAAFNTFKNAAERGQGQLVGGAAGATAAPGETVLQTIHQNTITSVRAYSGELGAVSHVSTTGVDGKLVVWDVSSVSTGGLIGKLAGLVLR